MAIQIRRKEENKAEKLVLEPEVLSAGGKAPEVPAPEESDVKVPGLNDEFLKKSGSIMSWLMEHRRVVTLITVIVIVISFGYYGVKYHQEADATEKSNVMSRAFVTYTLPTKDEALQAENARLEYMKSQGIVTNDKDLLRYSETIPNDRTRYLAIEKHLTQNLDTYKGETIETTGRLMQAGTSARLRDPDKVTPIYAAAEKSMSNDVKLFAMLGEAEMLIGERKFDDALMVLDNIMSIEPGMSSYATLEKGRIYEVQGKVDEAIRAYEDVFTKFGQPIDQQKALVRLRYLTADWAAHTQVAPAPIPAPQAAM